ncbi:unnamed protein product [Rotaria sp. Silwood1]|nr:unnamed protein product [Rotaria sp. Silwood1]CAF1582448.1 unnamed protein product [Rotaria sp. Silwood1]CAF3679980.1 unnamed protein product [Rotaria sp. Silwood1]CAF4948182.1 unnamed protein product [Rotaria sp. Silwood1]
MNEQLIDNVFIKKSNEYKQSTLSPLTDMADSGIVSRITPLSSINENKLNIHHYDDESITTENQSLSFNLTNISKLVLKYKKCEEYVRYPNCLITYLDHPSAIFLQIFEDGSAFQQMHQDINRFYMNNLNAYSNISTKYFEIGDFCVAYSSQYFEFFRARILNIDHRNKQYLVIYVDFGNSEWIHIKGIRPLYIEFTKLKIQSIPVTLSHILPKKDLKTDTINWNTDVGKQCTRKLRRLLIKPDSEPFLFVSVTFLSNENWWPLHFVDIKIDGQDLANILHNDGLARLTRNNKDLKIIYPNFGKHPSEQLIFGIQLSK